MDTTTLASRVTYLRESAGIGRKKLSMACSLGASHIGQLERGDVTSPGVETLLAIASRTGAPFEWLATGSGTPPTAASIAARFAEIASQHDDDDDAAPSENEAA